MQDTIQTSRLRGGLNLFLNKMLLLKPEQKDILLGGVWYCYGSSDRNNSVKFKKMDDKPVDRCEIMSYNQAT